MPPAPFIIPENKYERRTFRFLQIFRLNHFFFLKVFLHFLIQSHENLNMVWLYAIRDLYLKQRKE